MYRAQIVRISGTINGYLWTGYPSRKEFSFCFNYDGRTNLKPWPGDLEFTAGVFRSWKLRDYLEAIMLREKGDFDGCRFTDIILVITHRSDITHTRRVRNWVVRDSEGALEGT